MTTTDPCGDLLRPTMTEGVSIEMLSPGSPHADWMARLHVDDLPHGLFPRLGTGFVRRWHRSHLESPHGVAFVAVLDGSPIGLALGTTDRPANMAWLLQRRRRALVPAALLALVLRPMLLSDFVATVQAGTCAASHAVARSRPLRRGGPSPCWTPSSWQGSGVDAGSAGR